MSLPVKRKSVRFYPNPKRVVARFFRPQADDHTRSIISRILNMPEATFRPVFNTVFQRFSHRHRNITRILKENFQKVVVMARDLGIDPETVPEARKLVIGAYFTMEYSIEAAAFFNPSIVEDPYQGGLGPGQKRVIVSFRATGEGHISSIAFRSGIIDENNELTFVPAGDLVDTPEVVTRHVYRKAPFLTKLTEMGIKKDVIPMVMDQLPDEFIYGQLQAAIAEVLKNGGLSYTRQQVVQAINWLATSHYEVSFSLDTAVSDRVLFPVSYTESNGIEDARFVRFTRPDGEVTYYATYTAFNGYAILPKLIETQDFYHFKVLPINGECAQNKGMALFPRKIGGQYAMLSRVDGVNNYIMLSDSINLWQSAQKIQEPTHPWEMIQVGNCGSPIETDRGWLVITHGVGPMRTYSLGALLLDLKNPRKVIGRLKEPLLVPNDEEREGYVPNVVYSCGSIAHNGELVISYAMSDYAATFASVPLEDLLEAMKGTGKRSKAKVS
jgi:predicted GH43/DUF377 family glycosyl hydrolase